MVQKKRSGALEAKLEIIIESIRGIAVEYFNLTGKPLGVTGEIAEYEAARALKLTLAPVRQAGYDATKGKERIQIKGRRITADSKPGQRIGSIRFDHEWDCVVLVLLDERYQPIEIYKAFRPELEAALMKPGSKARNERGQLSLSKFKSIGTQVWGN